MARKKKVAPAPNRKKAAPPALTAEHRSKLLKPGDNLNELIDVAAAKLAALKKLGKRIPTRVTPNKLKALYRRYETSRRKEQALEQQLAARLRKLSDRRLIDGDAALRAVLDVKDAAAFAGDRDPEIAELFAELRDALTTARSPGKNDTAEAPAPGATVPA